MAKMLYCWRCKREVPMLDEHEWELIKPGLTETQEGIKAHRKAHGTSLREALVRVYGSGALRRYFELTGFREANINAILHHRLSQFGPPCATCGKPLRTPRAKLCVECGTVPTK
jgi:DNA-directed RNA polymerase subunit RPC12/RpoP